VFALAALVLIPLFRSQMRRAVTRLVGAERVALIGDAASLGDLGRKIQTHPEYGVDPVGIVAVGRNGAAAAEMPVLGTLADIDVAEFVRRHAIDRMIVAHDEVDDHALLELMRACGSLSVKVSILPRHFDAIGPSVEVDDIEGVTVLDVNPLVLPRSSRFFKRCMDVTGAAVAIMLTSPLMAVCAVAILIDSGRPILFRQERVGRRGESFGLLKFRTMVPDAEEQTEALLERSQDPHWLHLEDDPRVTRIGAFMRTTSLDELPQLLNVLKGEMSLVGPRPLLPYQDARLSPWGRTRLDLAPGITGLWQVLGRTSIPFEEMVKLDTLYVTNWTIWLDVKLLLRTVRSVLTRRGAN
jgi:exopolysaccharide biosynthesis polyprenyl glycosylphosphotransferase